MCVHFPSRLNRTLNVAGNNIECSIIRCMMNTIIAIIPEQFCDLVSLKLLMSLINDCRDRVIQETSLIYLNDARDK